LLSKVQRMRYVRSRGRSYYPRKAVIVDEDWLYETTDQERARPPKQTPGISPNMKRVYAAMMTSIEHDIRSLTARTSMTKSQVTASLEGLAYRNMVVKVRAEGGLRVSWRLD